MAARVINCLAILNRSAEIFEWLAALSKAARARGLLQEYEWCLRDQAHLLDSWGNPGQVRI